MSLYLDNVNIICSKLVAGQIVLCPTDTVWGISCDATNQASVEKVYKIKDRDRNKPLILLVDSLAMLRRYATDIHPRIEDLLIHYTKPLTIVHKASRQTPPYLLNIDQTIGIRLTRNELLKEIIGSLGRPIVSTSANRQGQKSPTVYNEISTYIKDEVDYIFQSGREITKPTAASQIVKYTSEGELIFLR